MNETIECDEKRRPLLLTAMAAMLFAGCGGAAAPAAGLDGGASSEPFVLVANVENSAFVGVWNGALSGAYANGDAFEVASYSYAEVFGKSVLVSQNYQSDAILRFEIGADGKLTRAGMLQAPAQSVPSGMLFVSDEKAYVSLPGAGKVLVFNPTTMTLIKEIDFLGPTYAISEPGKDDQNPNPGALGMRDGTLFVALAQQATMYTNHKTMDVAIVDMATNTVEKVISDKRGLAQTGGELDRIYLDDNGDLYVYGAASYGFDPTQAHGFLRIKAGETEFDQSYLFNLTEAQVAVPGGKVDYLNHMIYGGNGVAYCTGDVPALASSPPDYSRDFTMQPLAIDMRARTVTVLPLPTSNGYSGAVARYDEGHLIFALAAREGVGLYVFDLATRAPVMAPSVTTQGYVSAIGRGRL
jgi:hypothetical protein